MHKRKGDVINMIATVIITLVIAVISAMIIVNKINKSKNGQGSCGCGCSGCAMSNICHKE